MKTKFYMIVRPIVKGIFYFLFRPTVYGKQNILDNGPIILAGNHTKWLDPIMLVAVSKRQIQFLAKEELFHGITKFIVMGMGCIPVNRKIHDKGALNQGIESLKNGSCIGIFPEGTINRTKDIIMPFKIGAVKMSYESSGILVPFVITGKYKLFRKGIKICFLEPRKVSDNLDLENKKLMEEISKKLMEEINERN